METEIKKIDYALETLKEIQRTYNNFDEDWTANKGVWQNLSKIMGLVNMAVKMLEK